MIPLAVVQARMGSRRLHGKVLADLGGKPLVWWSWKVGVDADCQTVVAIPATPENDELAKVCQGFGANVFRWDGPEDDVLGRFHAVAHRFRWRPDSIIVRLTADDPFRNVHAVKRVIAGERLPVQQGGEAFTLGMLDMAYAACRAANFDKADPWIRERREHITHALFPTEPPPPPDGQVWSVDTAEDLEAARKLVDAARGRAGQGAVRPHYPGSLPCRLPIRRDASGECRVSRNGEMVRRFEEAFAEYVGAKYCIALCNGTATLHTALVAWSGRLGDQFPVGSRVQVPPLTMSATTIAVLQAGMVPDFQDVDPDTWLMRGDSHAKSITVALYGLHAPWRGIIDAAQTLQPHSPLSAFTSYSFQASKLLALGEGGALCTNDEELATRARSFSSLGYKLDPRSPRIDPATLKHPSFERHHTYPAWNYRMSDVVASRGLAAFGKMEVPLPGLDPTGYAIYPNGLDGLKAIRQQSAALYRQAISGCDWIKPQHVPEGWVHDYWAYAVALESAELWEPFTEAVVRGGGEMPFGAWRLTFDEPCFRHLAPPDDACPVARSLQPRLVQFQTNRLDSAERNAEAVRQAIREIGGSNG